MEENKKVDVYSHLPDFFSAEDDRRYTQEVSEVFPEDFDSDAGQYNMRELMDEHNSKNPFLEIFGDRETLEEGEEFDVDEARERIERMKNKTEELRKKKKKS